MRTFPLASRCSRTGPCRWLAAATTVAGVVGVGLLWAGPAAADTPSSPAAPVVSGVTPSSGPLAGGEVVAVTGSGLDHTTAVTVGGTPAYFFDDGPTSMRVIVPPGHAGAADLVVSVASEQSAVSAADRYTYVDRSGPVVAFVTPPAGPTSGGTVVQIVGTGFTGATAVDFAGIANQVPVPAYFAVASDTVIYAIEPPLSVASDVVVSVGAASSPPVYFDRFQPYGPASPRLSRTWPWSGPAAGGTLVTLTGSGLGAVTSVSFGSVPAPFFSVRTDGLIYVYAPPGVPGSTVDITVSTAAGSSYPSSDTQFHYDVLP